MAKIIQGVGGVNRELRQLFGGVEGVNREFKERWEGVGGVNRKVFSSGIFPILYDYGTEDLAVSGGWVPSSGNVGTIIVTKNTNTLYVCSNRGGSNNAAAFMTGKPIDLTNYNYLKFNIESASTTDSESTYIGQIGLCSYPPTSDTMKSADGLYGRIKTVDVRAGSIPTQIDISSYKGACYLYFGCNEVRAAFVRQITMSKIWLE